MKKCTRNIFTLLLSIAVVLTMFEGGLLTALADETNDTVITEDTEMTAEEEGSGVSGAAQETGASQETETSEETGTSGIVSEPETVIEAEPEMSIEAEPEDPDAAEPDTADEPEPAVLSGEENGQKTAETLGAVNPSLSAAAVVAVGRSAGVVRVNGKVQSKVRSRDAYYYLFEVNPYTNGLVKNIAKVKKASSIRFNLKTAKNAAYPNLKYALAVKTGNGTAAASYTRISPAVFVKNPEKAAVYTTAYKYPKTKKGLQSMDFNAQVKTGSKNCFINIYVSTITNGGYVPYKYNGKTYYFNDLWGVQALVYNCNQAGISVTAQVMLDEAAPDELKASPGGGGLYAFNVKSRSARMEMDAIFSYLAEMFGSDVCYISNWILGNEVNSCDFYWHMGYVSEEALVENYTACFRSLYNAVRSRRASSRVFICLDHCWNTPNSGLCDFPARNVLARFNIAINNMQKNVRWNLAFHAYPLDLRMPDFWNDSGYAVQDSPDSLFISPKNLRMFTSYIKNTYGNSVRILISEIGFNHYGVSENTQAAALALAYDIAACDPYIDGFFVRSYEDEQGDLDQGVAFGMYGRKAFSVFKYMDTVNYHLTKTEPVLKSVLGSGWRNYVPGFKEKRLYKMYVKK